MKIRLLFVLILVLTSTLLIANPKIIDYFRAESGGDYVKLTWKSADESNVSRYELERSAGDEPYEFIHYRYAKGSSYTYSYEDHEAFLKPSGDDAGLLQNNSYSYRIKIVFKDDSFDYSTKREVSHKASSVRRTWGMIKEMFR